MAVNAIVTRKVAEAKAPTPRKLVPLLKYVGVTGRVRDSQQLRTHANTPLLLFNKLLSAHLSRVLCANIHLTTSLVSPCLRLPIPAQGPPMVLLAEPLRPLRSSGRAHLQPLPRATHSAP